MQLHYYEVLRRPIITERSTMLNEQGRYTFEVARPANKAQIKDAVQRIFKVNVTAVNVISMPSKTKRVGKKAVQTQPWKKAVVTVRHGQRIEMFEGV
jgi:large subunit ribosomal protein L23